MTANHTDFSIRQAFDPATGARMGTSELRDNFHIGNLFTPGRVKLTYTHY
ncbi:MAG TPA: 5-dehydro-4-deoxy-D-glucuronate isomerase, partial [Pseudorhizobium sp.]|nr:5-dehydro-4-deoxy-D-glucuronate isomerase [Pseudorhizobium sp.]